MTAETTSPSLERPASEMVKVLRSADRFRVAIGCIVAAQAIWLWILMARGWFYQDDFTFLAQAVGRPLDWSYLSGPVNSHLTPGLRLQFWVVQHFAPFNHAATMIIRISLQAAATALLARLLAILAGRRPGTVIILAIYAFTPMLVPGTLWYAASANLLPAQILSIAAVYLHVRYTASQRLIYALCTGLALLGAAMFWEKSATIALTLPILSVCFLTEGALPSRLRATLQNWAGWLAIIMPLAAFLVFFAASGYGKSFKSPNLPTVVRLIAEEWSRSIAPSIIGGPWQWFSGRFVYESFSATPVGLQIAAQCIFLIAVGVGIWRGGWRTLFAWLIPFVTICVGIWLVAAGRYSVFGGLLTQAYTYVFDSAVPIAMASALALMPSRPTALLARALEVESSALVPSSKSRGRREVALAASAIAACVLLIVSAGVSSIKYSNRWAQNPSGRWADTLIRSARAIGPQLNLYDSGAPISVLPIIDPDRHISDVLGAAHLSATYGASTSEPKIVDDSGHIMPAVLLQVATADLPAGRFCSALFHGESQQLFALKGAVTPNEYFLRLEYFQQRPTHISVSLYDARRRTIKPIPRSDTILEGTLAQVTFRLPSASPSVVLIRSTDNAANLCITRVALGVPVPAGRGN